MKKKLVLVIIAVMIALIMVGCGSSGTATVTDPPATEPPEFTVHAYLSAQVGQPRLWAWSDETNQNAFSGWPGAEMTAGQDGWYSISVPTWIDHIIVNGNEGATQTADIPVEAKELWIAVNSDFTYELSYDGPIETVKYATVHAYIPAAWSNPGCWAWAGNENAFDAWPGETMNMDGNWYTIQIPNWSDHVIINGNGGDRQTADLPVEPGSDVWVLVSCDEAAVVMYAEPTSEELKEMAHDWVEPTCINLRYCSVCELTEGTFGDHVWKDMGCTKICSLCDLMDSAGGSHILDSGDQAVTGTCTMCGKYIENFFADGKLYAWTEFDVESGNKHTNPITYLKSGGSSNYHKIQWIQDGQLVAYSSDDVIGNVSCTAYYAEGKVYYFKGYSEADENTVSKLANAASRYISWSSCIYNEYNCTTGQLVGPGGWLEDNRGWVYAAMDVNGKLFCIAHKEPASGEEDDPTATWAIACNWK